MSTVRPIKNIQQMQPGQGIYKYIYILFSAHLKLHRHTVHLHPFRNELHAHRALKVFAELVVVESGDEIALSHACVSQQNNL